MRLPLEHARGIAQAWTVAKAHGIWVAVDKLRAELFHHGYLVKQSRSGRTRLEEYPLGKKHRV